MVTRSSGGSSMRSRATVRKYGASAPRIDRRSMRSIPQKTSQTTRSTRSFAGNTGGGNQWRTQPRTSHKDGRSVTFSSNKSGNIKTMNVRDKKTGVITNVTIRDSKTGYKGHANAKNKDGLKYSYKYNVTKSNRDNTPKTATVSKAIGKVRTVKQMNRGKTRGEISAVKGSGIKTIRFKSIKASKPKKSKVGKGLTTLSKTRRRRTKTVTKMGPHGTVKSVTKGRPIRRTGPRKQLY